MTAGSTSAAASSVGSARAVTSCFGSHVPRSPLRHRSCRCSTPRRCPGPVPTMSATGWDNGALPRHTGAQRQGRQGHRWWRERNDRRRRRGRAHRRRSPPPTGGLRTPPDRYRGRIAHGHQGRRLQQGGIFETVRSESPDRLTRLAMTVRTAADAAEAICSSCPVGETASCSTTTRCRKPERSRPVPLFAEKLRRISHPMSAPSSNSNGRPATGLSPNCWGCRPSRGQRAPSAPLGSRPDQSPTRPVR